MSKLSKYVMAAGLAALALGCAGTQKGTEVAEHGSARSDGDRYFSVQPAKQSSTPGRYYSTDPVEASEAAQVPQKMR